MLPHVLAENLSLLKDRLGGLFLFVGRVAILAKDAFHHRAEFSLNAFLHRPINRCVLVDGRTSLPNPQP
jgi:hypothetical protein